MATLRQCGRSWGLVVLIGFLGVAVVHYALPPLTIARLYKCRWQIDLFFKWIKQYLRIKTFYGTSDNAVKTQIWTAISVYVLAAIIKKELHLDRSCGEILQILRITLFEKEPIHSVLAGDYPHFEQDESCNQLFLFRS